MKRSIWTRILAVVLVLCMLQPVTVSAAGARGGDSANSGYSSIFKGFVDWFRSRFQLPGGEEAEVTEATDPTESGDTDSDTNDVMTLIEDETTVVNGDMLRASTYVLSSSEDASSAVMTLDLDEDTYSVNATSSDAVVTADDDTSTVLKYFPVTLYDYDADTINNATHALEVAANANLTEWEGIYFSGGSPSATSYGGEAAEYTPTYDSNNYAVIEDGTYYIGNGSCYVTSSVEYSPWRTYTIQGTTDSSSALALTIEKQSDGSYHVYYLDGSTKMYMDITATNAASFVSTANKLYFVYSNGSLMIKDGDLYLNRLGGDNWFGGYSSGSAVTLYTSLGASSYEYAAWNWWNKNSGDNDNGQKTWTGLVESSLDANKDIVFTKTEGGIFNDDATVKSIYTNVEMPFVYENGTYTFDASQNGVYFHEDSTQGSSGTAASNTRLYFNEGYTQSNGGTYGDGSSTVWAPYNDGTSLTTSEMNYYFGMRTTIPFTMTSNGRMNETNDSSDPIQFSFSGDDDVWVFIDGQLVVDLGGIHNRLDVVIDFAENTVTYSESNSLDAETGSYNDDSFELEQTLFGGLIAQDRTTFAATDSHELTIFYLERGAGASNCKIEFNLPMKDTVTVTKHATQSWTEKDGKEIISDLTDAEQAIVDNISFGFTLYKSTDGENFEAVANTNYNLLNVNGQVIDTPSTDANGHFYLKNGQSARFVTTFLAEGTTYYVVEDSVESLGFVTPDYNFGGESADGFSYVNENEEKVTVTKGNEIPEQILDTEATENTSYKVTVYGSDESEDSVVFICENYLDAELPNPSARPAEDRIVIDYGLSVVIDALANDLYRGNSIEIIGVYGAGLELTDNATGTVYKELDPSEVITGTTDPTYGTASVVDGKITYQLTKQLTGVEVLNYVVKVTGTTTQETVGTTYTAYEYGIATVYIIPATTMYYEEDFTGLVTYNDGKSVTGWQSVGAPETDAQEPGVVGTHNDSPYGSDVAYLNDGEDSNGSSKYVSTTQGAAQFSYTFTGTGTSFYARTTNNTGYLKIVVTDKDGNTVSTQYRDTYYATTDNATTLYNIPVFTTDGLHYGTYTVTVTIAKEKNTSTVVYHSDFWLDGIRVYQPLDSTDDNYTIATSAYATDAEANMTNVTLRTKLLSTVDISYETRTVYELLTDEEGKPIYKTVEVLDEDGNPVYNEDGTVMTEELPVMVEVTKEVEVITWPEDGTWVLFTDTDGAIKTAEEYESIGPKEEVYLNAGQTVSFSLYDWDPNTNKIYLGIKAPMGTGTVTIGSTALSINNAADCYYDITSYGTVTTDDDGVKTVTFTITSASGLISVTNIKVTGNVEFTIVDTSNGGESGGDVEVEGDEG